MYRLTLAIHGTGIGKCGFKLLLKVCQQNWSRFSGNVCKDFNCFNELKAYLHFEQFQFRQLLSKSTLQATC
jgi:hypothetical protein